MKFRKGLIVTAIAIGVGGFLAFPSAANAASVTYSPPAHSQDYVCKTVKHAPKYPASNPICWNPGNQPAGSAPAGCYPTYTTTCHAL